MASALLWVLAVASLRPIVCLSTAGEARERALESAWSLDDLPTPPTSDETKVVAYKSPIKRVVALLHKMKAELEHEAAHEGEMYDRMVCWCKTNEKEKEKAIADAEARDKELSAEAEARSAKLGEQTATIAALQKQIAEDTEALKAATAMREGQASEFSDEEKSLVQDLTNLKNAIAILSRHHTAEGGASFVQLDKTLMSSLRVVLRDLALKRDMLDAQAIESGRLPAKPAASLLQAGGANGVADASVAPLLAALNTQSGHPIGGAIPVNLAAAVLQRHVAPTAAGFLQASASQPIFKSYAPQSGQIFGILKQLQEEFEANLSQEQKDEMKAREDYESLSATKTEQIEAAKEKLDAVQGAKADNQKALSDANENLQLTREQRSEDVEFLRNLRLQCQDLDKQWELRSRTRAQEIAAVANATAILTDDDNMDLLRQTVTFLQVNEGANTKALRSRAASSLRTAATQPVFDTDDLLAAWHGRGTVNSLEHSASNPRMQLSTLAVSVGLDSFTKVKELMDTMIADLQAQQKEEVDFKANCESELNKNEKETYEKNEEKEDLEATIERLERLIAKLTAETAEAKTQIEETDVAIKQASQNREKENAQFQSTVADQRATQSILKKAMLRLRAFYEKERAGASAPPPTDVPAPVLLQAQQTPPEKFVAYKNNAGASPVIGLIEQIIEDSKALEKEAVDGETSAQASYETFVKESNALIASLQQTIATNTKAKAAAAANMEQAKSDLSTAVGVLESLAAYEADLHRECDFVLRNFEKRQSARLAEIQAIQAAKAILSGAGLNSS